MGVKIGVPEKDELVTNRIAPINSSIKPSFVRSLYACCSISFRFILSDIFVIIQIALCYLNTLRHKVVCANHFKHQRQSTCMSIVDAISSNFWVIFLFFSILYPRLQQGMLQNARENSLKRLGRKRGTNVVTLIHRQETLSLFGLPIARYIDIDDSEELLRIIRLTPDEQPIDLIVHTPGGIALAATQIAFALKAHKGKTTVMVPHYAMSGGTLIALAADEILMDPHAVLGPVDPQIGTQKGTYAATSISKDRGDQDPG